MAETIQWNKIVRELDDLYDLADDLLLSGHEAQASLAFMIWGGLRHELRDSIDAWRARTNPTTEGGE